MKGRCDGDGDDGGDDGDGDGDGDGSRSGDTPLKGRSEDKTQVMGEKRASQIPQPSCVE